ncbi:hypothetical protein JHK82_012472 [Glycine max]|nr:hypothetical protein JHK85_012827 [Glycine max]KAG5154503.1 hypothetical protein JHK82_012472 [Glycine max]
MRGRLHFSTAKFWKLPFCFSPLWTALFLSSLDCFVSLFRCFALDGDMATDDYATVPILDVM